MLTETYQLLRKIEEGIKHKADVAIRLGPFSPLEITVTIVCTKDKQRYSVCNTFTEEDLVNLRHEDFDIESFINHSNDMFRRVYEAIAITEKA